MNTPVLHERTELQLKLYFAAPTHALHIVGQAGSGKYFLATHIAEKLQLPAITVTVNEGQSTISIDQIRALYTQTKTSRSQVIIVRDAQHMGREAQNAFLKLLEEPPENTYFILTSESEADLLSTIRSRCRQLKIHSPSERNLKEHFSTESVDIEQLLRLAEGNIGTISRAVHDGDISEKLKGQMAEAKQFYSADSYKRHLLILENSSNRDWGIALLSSLTTLVKALIAVNAVDHDRLRKLLNQAKVINETTHALSNLPGNPKIQLTKLAEML